jgi:3-hydroxyisobutyrate dehydrogenase-like beta-hydroxyacid dehydrogenase
MCNQISVAAGILGVCESLAYAKKAGLDGDKILETLNGGAAASRQLSLYAPRIFKGDFQPGFYIKHFVKDLGIAIEEAEAMKLELPMLKLAKTLYDKLITEGMGELGIQALYADYLPGR